jgi:hypothetical protein
LDEGHRLPTVATSDETSSPSLLAIVVGLLVLAVAGWIVLSIVFSTVRVILAYAGYVVVAVVAYYIGRTVGRSSAEP